MHSRQLQGTHIRAASCPRPGSQCRRHSIPPAWTCPSHQQKQLRERLVTTPAAGDNTHNFQQSSSDEETYQLHAPSPQQLEHAWAEQTADSLADEFLRPYKATHRQHHQQQQAKVFVFVRHGHSTWNEQSRIQGNTDESELTALGRLQAVKARDALSDMKFDSCFSSPHTRARQTTEIVWQHWQQQQQQPSPAAAAAPAAEQQVIYLPSLSEVDLGWFQGLRNSDIARDHPELYRVWREEPERFCLDGRYPVLDAFRQSRRAWTDMLSSPGSTHLVITHKSLLRSMLCTALGLPPRQFRAIDLANGAVCMVRCNTRGDLMLSALNLTSHLSHDDVRYTLPGSNNNDKLAAAAGLISTAAAAGGSSSSGAAAVNYSQS